jgi:hypothetical protein
LVCNRSYGNCLAGDFSFSNITLAADACDGVAMTYDQFVTFKSQGLVSTQMSVSGNSASVQVNNNTSCTMPIDLISYKMYDQTTANQVFYAESSATVYSYSSQTITVETPSCMAQIDAYLGDGPHSLAGNPNTYGRLIDYTFTQNNSNDYANASGNFCTNVEPLTISCSASPSVINVNESTSWNALASGGVGSYLYSWTGTDSLYGSSQSVSKNYSISGTKNATVTVTSGGQTASANCSATVNQQQIYNNLTVSCSANPSSTDVDEYINWSANASGGTNGYTYSWTGTDGLYGNSQATSKYYSNEGTKYGYVTVTSNGQTATASCSARVYEDNNDDEDLYVSCYASPSNPQVGSQMHWYADVSGGDGDYDYDWSGTDGLDSSSRSPSMTYYNGGSKSATVRVYSDGQSDTATCYANVNQNTVLAYSQYNQTPMAGAVYLSQVPYTGLADNLNLIWFIIGLALFSAYIAYVIYSYKKENA